MTWAFANFTAPDGALLRWAQWKAEPEKGLVLFLPGRVEFIEKYGELAEEWAARGWRAVCLDWRGQGGSTRDVKNHPHRGHIADFKTYVVDLAAFWQAVWLPLTKETPTVLLAHSTGAHVLLRFLGEAPASESLPERRNMCAPVVVSSPLVRPYNALPPWVMRLGTEVCAAMAPAAYAFHQRPFAPEGAVFEGNIQTGDEQRFHAWHSLRVKNPALNTGGATWAWVRAALRSEQRLLEAAPRVCAPVLALLTPCDRVVDGPAQLKLARTLPDCTSVLFPESRHEVWNEQEEIRRKAWKAVDSFVASAMR